MYKLIIALAAAFFMFILWVIYLANTGGSSIFFDFIRSIPNGDKLGHLCLFGTLTFGVIVGSRFRSFTLGNLNFYYGAVLVAIFVIGEELSQYFIPSRTFDIVDLTADSLGILMAACLAYLANKHLTKRSKATLKSDVDQ